MALTDTYTSPLDFETPEEKRKREQNKFRIMSTPILDAFQKKAAQGQAQVESFKFRQNASQFQQSNQEVQKFRQKVLENQGMWANTASQQIQPSVEWQKRKERTEEGSRLAPVVGAGKRVLQGMEWETENIGRPITKAIQTANRPFAYPFEQLPGVGAKLEQGREASEKVTGVIGENVFVPSNLLPGVGFGDDIARAGRTAAKPFVRGLKEQGGVRGVARRLATEEAGGTKLPGGKPQEPPLPGQPGGRPATPEDFGIVSDPLETGKFKFQQAAKALRENIATTEAERTVQRGQKLASSERIYQEAKAQGLSDAEAYARGRAAQSGKLAEVPGVKVDWNPAEAEAMTQKVNTFDFGQGTRANYETWNGRAAMLKLQSGEYIPENEIQTLEKVFGKDFADSIRKVQSREYLTTNLGNAAFEAAMVPKAVLSAADVSYPFRQGAMVGVAHPKEAGQSLWPMLKAFASPKVARTIDNALLNDPTILSVTTRTGTTEMTFGQFLKDYGNLRSLDAGLTSSEEVMRGAWASRLPLGVGKLVRASNRAFVTYGNLLRAKVLKTTLNNWAAADKPLTPDRLEAISNFFNRTSGRGTLEGNIRIPGTKIGVNVGNNAFTKLLQVAAWAPQYTISPIQAFGYLLHADPLVRKQAARDLAIWFGTGAAVLELANLSGVGNINVNPTSTDFGKIRIGNTRFNFWGTQQVLARTVAQVATGNTAAASRWLQGRLAPEWAAIYDVVKGRNYLGQPMRTDMATFKREAWNRGIPLAMQDIKDAISEAAKEPTPSKIGVAAFSVPFSLLGGTESTYQSKSESFKEAFKAKTGNEYIGQAGDKRIVQGDPELSRLYNERQEDLRERGVESATEAKERTDILVSEEQKRLLPIAQEIAKGNIKAGPEFVDAYRDLQITRAKNAARDFWGLNLDASDDPRAVVYRTWREINPSDPKYRDPETMAPDWDSYNQDRQDAFSQLDLELQKAIREELLSSDPTSQEIERKFKQADDLRSQYYDLPKWNNKVPNQDQVIDAQRLAAEKVRELAIQGKTNIPSGTIYQLVGRENNVSKEILRLAYALRPGTKESTAYLNSARADLLRRNREILFTFYPEMYSNTLLAGMANPQTQAGSLPRWAIGRAR